MEEAIVLSQKKQTEGLFTLRFLQAIEQNTLLRIGSYFDVAGVRMILQ
jgi:hypothetical protein